MTVDLDKETQRLIEQELLADRFPDASTLVGAAVRWFLITKRDSGYTRQEIDAGISQAIASLQRGEGVDGEVFFTELEREQRKLQRPRG